jgi:hypothetical protein
MSDLLPKDIAAWHRTEAKKYQELAAFHKKTADTIEFGANPTDSAAQRYRRVHPIPAEQKEERGLTLEQFEKALDEKKGRVNHLAARLQVGEDKIWDLLNDPNCKFVVGDRGFIYPKEKPLEQ